MTGYSVCRMHGAGGGAPTGKANGRYRTGLYTAELVAARQLIAQMARIVRQVGEEKEAPVLNDRHDLRS